jgi:hypothetical protein
MRQRFTADFKPCLQLLAGTEIALNARRNRLERAELVQEPLGERTLRYSTA